MKDIFKTVFTACAAIDWLKQVSADEGQLDTIDENGSYKVVALLPCLLIDVQEAQWEAGDLTGQYGTAQVVTRLAYRKTNDTSNLTKPALFEASLAAWDRRTTIEAAIATIIPTTHGRLQRITSAHERRNDGIVVFKTTWLCSISETLE